MCRFGNNGVGTAINAYKSAVGTKHRFRLDLLTVKGDCT